MSKAANFINRNFWNEDEFECLHRISEEETYSGPNGASVNACTIKLGLWSFGEHMPHLDLRLQDKEGEDRESFVFQLGAPTDTGPLRELAAAFLAYADCCDEYNAKHPEPEE